MTDSTTPGAATAPIIVVSGNPRPGSRTLKVGRVVAVAVGRAVGLQGSATDGGADPVDIEVSAFGTELFRSPDQRPAALLEALQAIRAARLVVVATPVYKASYTGLLKAFLDHYRAGELSSSSSEPVVAIPVVVTGSPAHTFVGELYLRPLLTEIGAVVPTPSFAITESRLADVDTVAGEWVERFARVLGHQLGVDQREQSGVEGS